MTSHEGNGSSLYTSGGSARRHGRVRRRLNESSYARPVKIAAGGVLATVVAGGVFAVGNTKTITLDIDGQSTELSTMSANVGDALHSVGFEAKDTDLVSPSPSTSRWHSLLMAWSTR